MNGEYTIYTQYPADMILRRIAKNKGKIKLNGKIVSISTFKMLMFKRSSKCTFCGRKGHVFRLEKHRGREDWHLNLYCVEDGRYIQLTKDHIHPLSKGGKNELDNLQTLCYDCNQKKGDILPKDFGIGI